MLISKPFDTDTCITLCDFRIDRTKRNMLQNGQILLYFLLCLGYVRGQAASDQIYYCLNPSFSCCAEPDSNATSCHGQCKYGFHGENCTYKCPRNCLKCTGAEEAANVANCTQCREGYYSAPTKYQCEDRCSQGCRSCESYSKCTECYYSNILVESFCLRPKNLPAGNCISPCSCCNMSCDTDFLCGGNCIDGYHGERCRNYCPRNCVRCVDAVSGGGGANCTLCKNGYFSSTTLYQCQQLCPSSCKTCDSSEKCTSCRYGDFLTISGQCVACPDTCLTCDSSSHCTSCRIGYYTDRGVCLRCSPLCYSCSSPDSCICSVGCNSDACDLLTGNCDYGCKYYFTNLKCDACLSGMYGSSCNDTCSEKCESSCGQLTGKCSACREHYFGDFCDEECPSNCISTCGKATGYCDACKKGYFGSECILNCSANCAACTMKDGLCTTCIDGFYGNACNSKCPVNCLLDKCLKTSGSCQECKVGYKGDFCNTFIKGKGTTVVPGLVITKNPGRFTAPAVGGTLGGLVVIGVLIVVIVVLKRRATYIYPQNTIKMDSYKLDLSLIDALEKNDEFITTYVALTSVDDTPEPCARLPVGDLAQFVNRHGLDFFRKEFQKLPPGLIKPCYDAKKDENIVKNRYTGIYPYDEHRVRLLPPSSDFINACYIDGFEKKKEYIASLGPTMKAMEHFQLFWRMVWQEKTDVIVMVTNLIEGQSIQCEQYWPDTGASTTYGDVTVTSLTEEISSEFIVRTLLVARDGEQRELHHVHYTAWPDKRVPDDITSLIEFRQKVKSIKPVLGGPTIVHCSAGIGHTGTYIALDILIKQGKTQKALDIFDWVKRMREQRTSMVQTWEQYEYLHRSLVHALTNHCEPIKASNFQHFMNMTSDKRMTELFKQFEDKGNRVTEATQETEHIYTDLIREDVAITGNTHGLYANLDETHGDRNCINAIYVNSFKVKNRFLIAQTPLPETVKDFLRLITQEKCSCIVSMDPPGIQDQTRDLYFSPTNGGVFTHPSHAVDVVTQEMESDPSYVLKRLTVRFKKKSGSPSSTVYHFQCNHWSQEHRVPNIKRFLRFVQDVEVFTETHEDKGPVLIHCLNGAGRSGLFCAVSNLIQKMRLEGEVSVVNTLKQVKVRRPLAIPDKDQYVFCYQCVQQFVTSWFKG